MLVEIHPPAGAPNPPTQYTWYDLEIVQVHFNVDQEIHKHNFINNTFMMEGYEHSVSTMSMTGVLTVDSNFYGVTVEDKKTNMLMAASMWWTIGDNNIRTQCAQIKWRGWEQYIMIDRLEMTKVAGEEEYTYTLTMTIHEGA